MYRGNDIYERDRKKDSNEDIKDTCSESVANIYKKEIGRKDSFKDITNTCPDERK